VAKRPGRKRNLDVDRHPCGQINDYGGRVYPPNTQMNQEVRWEEGKNRGERYLVRPSASIVRTLDLTERQARAAEEFASLRDACAKYAWDAPKFTAKASSPFQGKAHPSEQDPDHIVSLGAKFHAKYMDVVRWTQGRVQWGEGKPRRGFLGIAVRVCLQDERPSSEGDLFVLRHGLNILADRWKL
jgi:hypothetical protein